MIRAAFWFLVSFFMTALILAAYSEANAAQFCIAIRSTPFTSERCAEVSDAALPLFFDAYKESYGTVKTPAGDRPATQQEQFALFAAGIGDAVRDHVKRHAEAKAAEAAKAALPPIEMTPVQARPE